MNPWLESILIIALSAGSHALRSKLQTWMALEKAGEVMASVNLDASTDHWVVVLKITDTTVETADPIYGLHVEPRADFERRWRWECVVVE